MGEKKMKQNIAIIAILITLCGYYTAPESNSSNLEKTEQVNNVFPCDIEQISQQDETLCLDIELAENEKCISP